MEPIEDTIRFQLHTLGRMETINVKQIAVIAPIVTMLLQSRQKQNMFQGVTRGEKRNKAVFP
jgi:hypothetical protein